MHETLRSHKVKVYYGGTLVAAHIRPNDPCPCGSGKKAKRCCGCETRYYRSRSASVPLAARKDGATPISRAGRSRS